MHNLSGSIYKTPSECRGIPADRNAFRFHICFESFEYEKSDYHNVIESTICAESFERKFFCSKILECTIYKFVPGSVMISLYDGFRFNGFNVSYFHKFPAYFIVHIEIGIDKGFGPFKVKNNLSAFITYWFSIDASVGRNPAFSAINEIMKVPQPFSYFVFRKCIIGDFCYVLLDIVIHLSANYEPNFKFVAETEEFFIKETRIGKKNNGNFG